MPILSQCLELQKISCNVHACVHEEKMGYKISCIEICASGTE